MTWLLALALTALPLAPRIAGAPGVGCPSPRELEAALVGLLPSADLSVELRAVEDRTGSVLLVRINDQQGRLLGERRLRPATVPPEGCAERTQQVAVVVAAAVGQLQGTGVLAPPVVVVPKSDTLQAPAPEPVPAPRPPPAPPPAPAPAPVVIAPPPPPPRPAPARADVVRLAPPVAVAPPRRLPALGVSLAGSLMGGTLAPSATADVTLRAWPRLPIALGALYVADHAMDLGAGQVAWWRLGLTASLAYRLPLGRAWMAEGGAGAAATLLRLEGRDVPSPSRSSTFDPGASLLLRFGHRGGRSDVWVGAILSRWLRPQGAFVKGSADAVDLPRWELSIGLGCRFDLGVTSGRVPT
ncbi:MAG TPA: hypothetical protein VMT03_21825 [Polyangia bacterium]|nr:hypothetical protein [Polyangia bacterium]